MQYNDHISKYTIEYNIFLSIEIEKKLKSAGGEL